MHSAREFKFGDRQFNVEVGAYADRASGSAFVRSSDTSLLAIVDIRSDDSIREFQLTTDYRARYASLGQIPNNFLKREMRSSDAEILMSRLLDRSIRPRLKSQGPARIVVSVMYLGGDKGADVFQTALLAISLALHNAEVSCPILIGETYTIGPNSSLTMAVEQDGLVMMEAALNQISTTAVHQHITQRMETLMQWARQIEREVGHPPMKMPDEKTTDAIGLDVSALWHEKNVNKRRLMRESLTMDACGSPESIAAAWARMVAERAVDGERTDGRGPVEIRPISVVPKMSPTAHGCILFRRGLTSALVLTTLGSIREAQDVQDLFFRSTKDPLIVQYAFPPFATNQAEMARSMPNRREIGHGHLIKKALKPALPTESAFPFVVRINSEIMSADGSSSMASVMGATLSLAEAGVPLTAPVVGVSVGMFESAKGNIICLDLTEDEDHASAFDLKVTGTKIGMTAIQLDIKTRHLSTHVLVQALQAAESGIADLLETVTPLWQTCMDNNLRLEGRSTLLSVERNAVGKIIGSGGKNLKSLREGLNSRVELSKQGTVLITSDCLKTLRRTVHRISEFSFKFQEGRLYMATPQKETAEGLSIFIGTKYGHIPHDKLYPPISFETRLLVRFLGYNGKQTPIFERVDQDLYDASQAVNGEYKTEK